MISMVPMVLRTPDRRQDHILDMAHTGSLTFMVPITDQVSPVGMDTYRHTELDMDTDPVAAPTLVITTDIDLFTVTDSYADLTMSSILAAAEDTDQFTMDTVLMDKVITAQFLATTLEYILAITPGYIRDTIRHTHTDIATITGHAVQITL